MFHLRSGIVFHLLSSKSAAPISLLHRLLSTGAPAVSAIPRFAVEDYLVGTCGLTPAQALKASTKLSHLKSPSNPGAVLVILAGLGLSSTDVASLVAKDPKFLCTSVEKTLAPNVAGLTAMGLTRSEVARLVSLHPSNFRLRSIVSKMYYYLPIFGSFETFLRAVNRGPHLLSCDLKNAVKLNVAFLRECRLGACDIARLCSAHPRLLTTNQERVRAMVARAEGLGVPRGSAMFRHMLHGVAFQSEEKIALRVEYLKKTLRWSDAEASIALSKGPILLRKAKVSLQRTFEFLISEVGLEPTYIAHRPALLCYSLEGRLKPRYYVVKFLKENGLVVRDPSYFTVVQVSEKVFVDKYICPHKEVAPQLVEEYATACSGKVPTRFRFA